MLVMLFVAACETVQLPSEDLTEVKDQIASITKQIEAMQKTLDLLQQTDKELMAYIEELQNSGAGADDTASLQELKKELEAKIAALEEAINSTKDWVSTTFSTLDQYNELSKTLAEISAALKLLEGSITGGGEVSLDELIERCTASMQTWVNEKLTGYYTLAEAQAALEAMLSTVTEGDEALRDEIDALKKELADMEARLTEAYRKAIEEAIANGGTIPPSTDLDGTNGDLNAIVAQINSKISALESRVDAIEKQLSELVNRVQSLNGPQVAGDIIDVQKFYPFQETDDIIRLSYFVSPKNIVADLAEKYQSVMTFQVVENRYDDVGSYDLHLSPMAIHEIPIAACKADDKLGTLTIDVAVKDFPEEFFMYSFPVKIQIKLDSFIFD